MMRKLFIKFLLGKNKNRSDVIRINGIDYKVVIEPLASLDADRWIRLLKERKKENKMPEYFANLNNPKEGNVVTLKNLILHIPEGFRKHLNSMEKHQLLNEQLAKYGLKQGNVSFEGYSELIKTQKTPEPLKTSASVSNRLKEYLILFEAEQEKNKYKNSKQLEINEKVDRVINYICEEISNDRVRTENVPHTTEALAALITARSVLINKSSFKTCELIEELKRREGVEEITVEPYATKRIIVDGPAVILKVID